MQVLADEYTTKWVRHFRPLQQMEQKNVEQKWKGPEGYQQKSRVPQHAEVVATKMSGVYWCCHWHHIPQWLAQSSWRRCLQVHFT